MTTDAPLVVWSLDGFSNEDDTLHTELPISREQIIKIRTVIPPDADDPWMLHCYEVPLGVWPALDEILQSRPPEPGLEYLTSSSAAD